MIEVVKFVKPLKKLSRKDIAQAGGKGANLGEMVNLGLPVPEGFVVLTAAYKHFLEKTKLAEKIFPLLSKTDINNTSQLQENTAEIRAMIEKGKMPPQVAAAINRAYEKLSPQNGWVVARSSATAEDVEEASFAGQQLTVLNIKGGAALRKAVKRCWASLFTARAVFYRVRQGFPHQEVLIAVPVQRQVDSRVSGVGFTLDPATGREDRLMIEASWGQGESVVSGAVTPDNFLLDKKTGQIVQKKIAQKMKMKILDQKKGGLKEIKVAQDKQKIASLNRGELKQLYQLAKKLARHYSLPQDFEWAIENGQVYLLQTRPVTVFYPQGVAEMKMERKEKSLLQGLAASPGVATGPVKIIPKAAELEKIKKGDILVTQMTNPDFVVAMKRAAGVVTDEGGQTSHAAIVSRELGIPCIVGTRKATKKLKDGQTITLNASEGIVYPGRVKIKVKKKKERPAAKIKTKTKIYLNLGQPDLAEKYQDLPVDGIGLLRAEFMAAELGQHPKLILEKGGQEKLVEKWAIGIGRVARAFSPRPVVYRALDFKTNEYAGLKGGEKYEPEEANPMLGWRGASRYITEPEIFQSELAAIKKIRDGGLTNVWLMLPFVRTVWELAEIKKMVQKTGLAKEKDFQLWIMVEVPSTAILIEEFLKEGIDGVSIGSNDLTQLVLGVDRDSAILGKRWFNELDPAVLWSVKRVVKACRKHQVPCSICGQAPSVYPQLVKKLVRWGITSLSVNPDAVEKTRALVAKWEKNFVTP